MRIWLSIIFYILVLNCGWAETDRLQQAQEIAKQALQDISSNVSLSLQQLQNLHQTLEKAQQDQKNLQANITKAKQEKQEATKQLTKDEALFNTYRKQQAIAQQKYDKIKLEFATIIAALERLQLSPPPILVAHSEDIKQAIRAVDVLNLMVPRLKDKVYVYMEDVNNLQQTIEATEKQKKQLIATLENYELSSKKLEALLQLAVKQAENSKTRIANTQETLVALKDRQNGLQKFLTIIAQQEGVKHHQKTLQALEAKLARTSSFSHLKGKLTRPVQGKVLENFYNKADSEKKGEMLLAQRDDKIIAPSAAIVAYAGKFRHYGNIIILNMGENYYMILANIGKLLVKSDSFVDKGTVLGLVDSSKTIYVELKSVSESVNLQYWWM